MDDAIALLEALLASRPDHVAATLLHTCAAVRKAAPDACEHVFDTYVVGSVFTFTGKLGGAFCHPVAYANHVNLGFNRGAELDDPTGLLAGTGKLIRHVRIDGPVTLKQRAVQDLIRQAVQQGMVLAQMRGGPVPRHVIGPASRAAAAKKKKKPAASARKQR